MKLAAFCLLSVFAFQCSGQEPAHITIFREKSTGNRFVASAQQTVMTNRNFVQPQWRFQIFLDGTEAVIFKPGHFISFDVPAGHHEVRSRTSERLILDLKAGEHAYIHLGVHASYRAFTFPETIEQTSCQTVAAYIGNQVLEPVKLKSVKFGEVAPETAFPGCTVQPDTDQAATAAEPETSQK